MERWSGTSDNDLAVEQESYQDIYDTFLAESRFWIQRVLLPLVVVIGVLGNGVTIIVLTRPKMRGSTNTYLTALAISDLFYLIFAFTVSLEHYPGMHGPSSYYYWQYHRIALWITDASACTSLSLTVTFTIERYIAVCHPMRGKVICTESRAKIAIVIVYLFCFLANITTPLEWEVTVKVLDGNKTEVFVGLHESPLGADQNYRNVYYWFLSITFSFLPLILLSIFNSFLICAVHQSRRTRYQMTQTGHTTSNQKQENRISITLIAVVLFTMICQIPAAILLLLHSFYKVSSGSSVDKLFRALGNIFNFLVTCHAAANFILYCAISSRYRIILLSTFFKRCYKPARLSQTSAETHTFTHYDRGSFRSGTRDKSPYVYQSCRQHNNQRPKNGLLNSATPESLGEEYT